MMEIDGAVGDCFVGDLMAAADGGVAGSECGVVARVDAEAARGDGGGGVFA